MVAALTWAADNRTTRSVYRGCMGPDLMTPTEVRLKEAVWSLVPFRWETGCEEGVASSAA